jgi:hypothetical protein
MVMARKRKYNPEEHQKSLMESAIRDAERLIARGALPIPPKHRKFKVGERVRFGAHEETYIREIFRDGLYYRVESVGVKRDRDKPAQNEQHVLEWHNILPLANKGTNFRQEEKYYIRMLNSGIASILQMVYHSGVDMEVEYQREHVWTQKDKVDLIDSIFNNIDIGKFVFVQRDFSTEGALYEILDGKQRLTALTEFYEDRFKYKGFYFSELSGLDKNKFENHGIAYGYLENPDKRAIFETFIKLNTCGKPMANKHINHVKQLLSEL